MGLVKPDMPHQGLLVLKTTGVGERPINHRQITVLSDSYYQPSQERGAPFLSASIQGSGYLPVKTN